jgi:tetratricopeptide (TPR) repeat protein
MPDDMPMQSRWLSTSSNKPRRNFGKNDVKTAVPLSALAILYARQGRYADAELVHQRALAIYDTALGANHPSFADSLVNLAALYMVQGRYADAEPLMKRALTIHEKALGANHLSVGLGLNNLGRLYWQQRRYGEAEGLPSMREHKVPTTPMSGVSSTT